MSLVQPTVPERRPSPGLSLNLSSNNPFRRAASPASIPSPALSTPASLVTPRTTIPRPVSRNNPFLDDSQQPNFQNFQNFQPSQNYGQRSPAYDTMSFSSSPQKPTTYGTAAEELFREMRLDDKKPAPPNGATERRPPPHRNGSGPIRPPRPGDDDRRRRPPPRPRGNDELDIFASPPRDRDREMRRPRRNSESSVMDTKAIEDERRRRERRRREREARDKDPRSGKSSKPVKKPQGLDIIDKLDVSGIYGPSLFHHDGPFDACNPHRNRKKDHRAPMEAFPVDSANNAMGGAGPVNKHINLDQFHGREAEGFAEWSSTNKTAPALEPEDVGALNMSGGQANTWYNPKAAIDYVHGDESAGLGTSTFLDGAPASRRDIERRESEQMAQMMSGEGLSRKKSLAQRFRGKSQPRREFGSQGRIQSPEAMYEWQRVNQTPQDELPPRPGQTQSAGGLGKMQERNPFFQDYDDAYEKKSASIRVAEQGRTRTPSSPGNGLERSTTADSFGMPPRGPPPEPNRDTKPTGLLGRMKSLKGGKRAPPRPERRPS